MYFFVSQFFFLLVDLFVSSIRLRILGNLIILYSMKYAFKMLRYGILKY